MSDAQVWDAMSLTRDGDSGADRRFDAALRARLYRFDCPTPARLQAFYTGDDACDDDRPSLLLHLRACPHCAAELEQMRAFVEEMPQNGEVPMAVAGWLRGLQEEVEQLARKMQLVIATALTPPRPQLAGVALRGAADGATVETPARSCLYATDDVDVSILWQRNADHLQDVSIQLFEQPPASYHRIAIVAARPAAEPARLSLHDASRTATTQLAPGRYSLVLESSERFVVIPDLLLE
jgi:hypothetical protein